MIIAAAYKNGEIFQHFGHSEQFKLYEVVNGQVLKSEVVDTNGSGHGALAGFLKQHQVNALICGGIGGGAKDALAKQGITLYGGVSGRADDKLKELLEGKLSFNPDIVCSHHDEAEGEKHNCNEHNDHQCGHNCHE